MRKAMLIMDMPDTCGKCQLCQGVAVDGDYVCSIFDEYGNERGYDDGKYSKPDWCPLQLMTEPFSYGLPEALNNYELPKCKLTGEELEEIVDKWNSISEKYLVHFADWANLKCLTVPEEQFTKIYCNNCGTQRCEGIDSEWFDGCKFKDHLSRSNFKR